MTGEEASPISDLTLLQWGNWWGSEVVHPADASDGNPSINVPNFGASWRGANMGERVVVALLDTAVYYQHPDLANIIYRFTPAQQEALGCGEWGFNAVNKGANGSVFDDDSIALGHGTHTAGIIGAEWNGSGTSGVASDVSIVAIELADGEGNESMADALCAFDFVNRFNEQAPEAERIRVTSNSWSEYMSSRALDAAVRDLGERWGIVSFFSSGNDGKNNDYYEKTPSSLADNPYAVIVANTNQTDALDESSEYGAATVDLAAPGTAILSTTVPSRGEWFQDDAHAAQDGRRRHPRASAAGHRRLWGGHSRDRHSPAQEEPRLTLLLGQNCRRLLSHFWVSAGLRTFGIPDVLPDRWDKTAGDFCPRDHVQQHEESALTRTAPGPRILA